jgi:uncharacterized protein YbjT (DUF2867 family)
MNIILLGATGMVGQGVLRECLFEPEVHRVLALGRNSTGQHHEKFRELIHADLFNLSPIESQLSGYDVCLFCLGQSSVGMSEADYRRVTYDLTLYVAQTLVNLNPAMTFIYVSGAGTDSTARGRTMWARVKGQTENALLQLPFKAAYMFRPAFIVPMHGIRSRTAFYRIIYALTGPLLRMSRNWFPNYITTTEQLALAMLKVAKQGYPKPILESADMNAF